MSIDRRSLASLARRPTRRRSARRRVAAEAQRTLTEIAGGRLARLPVTLRFWDGSTLPGGPPVVEVRHRRAISHLLHHPNQLGLARAWVDGSLAVPDDPEDVLHTRKAFEGLELSAADRLRVTAAAVRIGGPGILRSPPVPSIEASVSGGRHSLTRDRQAVRHHYDVSNDFYRLLLGPTMVYSCAYFATEQDSLEQAQEQKLDLICRKLRLQPGESLLDLGCGWGSLLLHAAAHYGVRAVGVTLSEPQAALGAERIARQGLQDRVEIRVADYREVHDGPYDKIASVGMYEHVGHEMLDEYTGLVRRLLAPGACSSTTGSRACTRPARVATRSPIATSSPTATCTRSQTSPARCSASVSRSAMSSPYATTTRSRCGAGWPTSGRIVTGRSDWSAPSASASGSCTCSRRRLGSRTLTSPFTRCSQPGRTASISFL